VRELLSVFIWRESKKIKMSKTKSTRTNKKRAYCNMSIAAARAFFYKKTRWFTRISGMNRYFCRYWFRKFTFNIHPQKNGGRKNSKFTDIQLKDLCGKFNKLISFIINF